MGAHHFLTFLRAQGVTAAPAAAARSAAFPTLLNEFQHWMTVHRGVTEQTLRNYRPIILDLLTTLGDCPAQFEAKSLRAFILDRAHRHGKGKAKNVVTATRMFVRFLIASGRCRPGLDDAIPTIAMWRLATLPQYLPTEDVERIIAVCDPSLPLGARDQAIILLMARLGLRGSDIVGLRFTDINWQDATLVVSGKSRRATRLPLPQDVGDALLHYLESARPPVDIDCVFIPSMAPWGPLSRSVIRQTAARAITRAGISAPTSGARGFRHSPAATMLRPGASPPTIGRMLPHSPIWTSPHHSKVGMR